MHITISQNPKELGKAAGNLTGSLIRETIAAKGRANIILATGASQFETLHHLTLEEGIAWGKVTMFHLDEYIGIGIDHPASFRKYLKERFLDKVDPLKAAYLIDGGGDINGECKRLGELLAAHPIDVALVGIGENGHLAFNDPPADFETEQPYIIAQLDEACRAQQLGEGWFSSLQAVPHEAISMSIKQILKSKRIICSVPDSRKAIAVKNTLQHSVSNLYPASILQSHPDCRIYLDRFSASLLSTELLTRDIDSRN